MCTNMFVWLLKIVCQTYIAFDQNKIIYDKKQKKKQSKKQLYICRYFNSPFFVNELKRV